MIRLSQEPLRKIFCKECNRFLQEPCWKHTRNITDKPVIPYALASLPDELYMDVCGEWSAERGIFAKDSLCPHTVFGPLMAPLSGTPKSSSFACRKDGTLGYYQLDSDFFSNWMKYVRYAQNRDEENLAVFMRGIKLVFVTTREIPAGEELKVGYSWQYAQMVGVDNVHPLADDISLLKSLANIPPLKIPETVKKTTHSSMITKEFPVEVMSNDGLVGNEGGSVIGESVQEEGESVRKKSKKKRDRCEVCGREFSNVQKHMQLVHPEHVKKSFKHGCSRCGRRYPTFRALQSHLKAAHRHVSAAPKETAVETAIQYMKTTGLFTYYCRPCLKHFPSKSLLDMHEFQHDSLEITKSRPERQCPDCSFTAPSFPDLLDHLLTHAIKPADKKCCLICGEYAFKIGTHIRSCHPEEMKVISADWELECEECGMKFKNQKDMGLHVRTVHKGFQCLYCAVFVYTSARLMEHMGVHKKDGVFPCPWCDKSFEVYAHFRQHHKDFHAAGSVKVCTVCRTVCLNSAKLATHMKIHAPIVRLSRPPIAGRKRKSSEERKLRKQVRSKDRVECEQCGVAMNRQSLWKHKRWQHNADVVDKDRRKRQRRERESNSSYVDPRRRMAYEEFPFKCEECHLGFLKQLTFNKHIDEKHPSIAVLG